MTCEFRGNPEGIEIEKIPGDPIGIRMGLSVEKNFFGNPMPSVNHNASKA